jgi:hypothetical protein
MSILTLDPERFSHCLIAYWLVTLLFIWATARGTPLMAPHSHHHSEIARKIRLGGPMSMIWEQTSARSQYSDVCPVCFATSCEHGGCNCPNRECTKCEGGD